MRIKKYFISILAITLLFTLTGCFSKEKINSKKFIDISKKEKLTIYEVTTQFKSYDNVKKVYAASNLRGWGITFFEFKNSDSAENIFNKKVEEFKKNKSKNDEDDKSGIRNYSIYELTTSNNYYYISRVDNTLLIVDADSTHKKEINSFIEKIKY